MEDRHKQSMSVRRPPEMNPSIASLQDGPCPRFEYHKRSHKYIIPMTTDEVRSGFFFNTLTTSSSKQELHRWITQVILVYMESRDVRSDSHSGHVDMRPPRCVSRCDLMQLPVVTKG